MDISRVAPPPVAKGAGADTAAVLGRLRRFLLPGGTEAARGVRAVRLTERGEICSAPGARWLPFTAEEEMDATRSRFRWEAHLETGPLRFLGVVDEYANGHGRLVVKVAGLVPVVSLDGPEADKGELQRYLGQIAFCPPALLHHPSLQWDAVDAGTLKVWDPNEPGGATVELLVGDDGAPLGCQAIRPRAIGRESVPTPWSGACAEPREWEGLRVPSRLEATWHLPEGSFTYYRAETTSLTVVR
jgi:hypothetical protein